MSLRQASLANNAIRTYLNQPIDITAQVATDPVLSAPKVRGSYFAVRNYTFMARAQFVSADGKNFELRVPIRIVTPTRTVADLLPGQKIHFRGTAILSKEARRGMRALLFQEWCSEILPNKAQHLKLI